MSWGCSPHSDYYIHIVNNFVFGFRTYCDFDFDSKATKFLTLSRSTELHELRPPKTIGAQHSLIATPHTAASSFHFHFNCSLFIYSNSIYKYFHSTFCNRCCFLINCSATTATCSSTRLLGIPAPPASGIDYVFLASYAIFTFITIAASKTKSTTPSTFRPPLPAHALLGNGGVLCTWFLCTCCQLGTVHGPCQWTERSPVSSLLDANNSKPPRDVSI